MRDVDPGALAAAFAHAGLGPLVVGAFCHALVMALYAVRWRLLLDRPAAMPVPRAFGFVGLGYLANYTLPGRPGELVRAGLARALGGVPLTLALASLLLEKVLDGLTILASATAYAAFAPPPDWLRSSVSIGGAAFAVGAIVLLLAALAPGFLSHRERARVKAQALRALGPDGAAVVAGPSPGGRGSMLRRQVEHVGAPLRLLRSRRVLLPVIALGLLIWPSIVLHQVLLALGSGVPAMPAAWLLFYAALGLASVVPGAPGYVGTYQLAAVYALGAFGVPPETAIVVATYYQLSRLLGALLVGSWAVSREGVRTLYSARSFALAAGSTRRDQPSRHPASS
jgi:uncharacterized protein (TIRG00374 family)